MKQVPYKRIMVALDLSDFDEKLIPYALWFAKTMKTGKVYFVHFVKNLIIPKKEYLLEEDDTPFDERLRADINQLIQRCAPDNGVETEIVVQEEHPLKGLLRWQKIKNIDLVMVGKKKLTRGSGLISRQFVRQSSCTVLFVPHTAQPNIKKILVPVDFSDNSGFALSHALRLHACLPAAEITCQHVYFVTIYSGKWKVNSQYPKYVYQSAIDNSERFLKQFALEDIPIESVFTPDEDVDVVSRVREYAEFNHSDIVVIGAQGHSKVKLLTIGSTAEKMMLSDLKVPLLVVR